GRTDLLAGLSGVQRELDDGALRRTGQSRTVSDDDVAECGFLDPDRCEHLDLGSRADLTGDGGDVLDPARGPSTVARRAVERGRPSASGQSDDGEGECGQSGRGFTHALQSIAIVARRRATRRL